MKGLGFTLIIIAIAVLLTAIAYNHAARRDQRVDDFSNHSEIK